MATAQPMLKTMKNIEQTSTTTRRPYVSLTGAEHKGPTTNASMNKPTKRFCSSFDSMPKSSAIAAEAGDTTDEANGPISENIAYIAKFDTR